MKIFLKNYKQTLILLFSIIIGSIFGLIFKEKIIIIKPLGDLFLNLLLVIIVPLIFTTLTTAIGNMNKPKRIGKILGTTLLIFIITSLVSVIIGLLVTKIRLINIEDTSNITKTLTYENNTPAEEVNFLERTIQTISVNNFNDLLSNNNMIALIIFSILIGISINLAKEKGKPFLRVINSLNEIIGKFLKIVMYYAPIGLFAYFAYLTGYFGSEIVIGYTKTFIIYTITAILFYFIIYSIYAFIAAGKKGFISYWKNILPATFTSLATCSSAASIPVNRQSAKNIGVPDDIASTVIPLGTSFHKDGSIIGSVFKIMFLVYLFNAQIDIVEIIGISLLATLLVTAVPIGGGTISEMLIITMLGFPLSTLPILTIIASIIDPPATMLNVVGDTASSMLVAKIIDGKNWINNFDNKTNI